MTKSLRIGLALLFLFQIIIAMSFELAHDEAYYWLYSLHLDWGYFDHPPFVGLIIKLFSFLPHSELAVRIGFIFLQFASLYLLLGLTTSQVTAFLLFFSFPLASFTGLLALPDIPLLFMTACYVVMLKKYLEKDSISNSLILGLVIALLFYAKYHGVLLIFFTLLAIPSLFKKKSFYLVALVAIVAFLPHMLWQYEHQFSTLRYHFLERPKAEFSILRSLEYLGLQMVLAGVLVGPIVWWITFKFKVHHQFDRAMKFIAIGTIVFFLISSFSKKVEANWTIFLAIPLIYLVADSELWKKRWIHSLLVTSFIIVVSARILFAFSPDTLGIQRLNEFHGWKEWSEKIAKACGPQPILANSYQVASKLSFYLKQEIGSINYDSRKNQFDIWKLEERIPTKEVCYVTEKKLFKGKVIPPPMGRKIHVVKNQSLTELKALKFAEENR